MGPKKLREPGAAPLGWGVADVLETPSSPRVIVVLCTDGDTSENGPHAPRLSRSLEAYRN